VICAEKKRRYAECELLSICVLQGTTHSDFISAIFPSNFYRIGFSFEEMIAMMFNDTCNVIGVEEFSIFDSELEKLIKNGEYVLGNKSLTKEPLSAVTRNEDREWSDIVTWAIRALIQGEMNGLMRNPQLCNNDTILESNSTRLNYDQSVYCVGNYGEIFNRRFGENKRSSMNTINKGSPMIYSTPLGNIFGTKNDFQVMEEVIDGGVLKLVKSRKGDVLRCGVVVSFDDVNITSVDYCHVLAAALFNGDFEAVEFLTFRENDDIAYESLSHGIIDALAGAVVNFEGDVDRGFSYSTPYYYRDKESSVDCYAFATRGDDTLFSSFLNAMVITTIHAQEIGATRKTSTRMPLTSLFGNKFLWAMRDAVSYGGNYDEIYINNFGLKSVRGRNEVNSQSGPQLLTRPGIPKLSQSL